MRKVIIKTLLRILEAFGKQSNEGFHSHANEKNTKVNDINPLVLYTLSSYLLGGGINQNTVPCISD
jgi:hypothetical protein